MLTSDVLHSDFEPLPIPYLLLTRHLLEDAAQFIDARLWLRRHVVVRDARPVLLGDFALFAASLDGVQPLKGIVFLSALEDGRVGPRGVEGVDVEGLVPDVGEDGGEDGGCHFAEIRNLDVGVDVLGSGGTEN